MKHIPTKSKGMNQELLNKYIAGDATPEEKERLPAGWIPTRKT